MAARSVDIVPDGDVYLICGGAKGVASKLRVSSVALKTGSPIFRKMLGPSFKEGQQLASKGFVDIPLKDDDPEAMTMLCRALHLQFVAMPEELNPNSLMVLSVAADKYDCTGSLRFASEVWIKNAMLTIKPVDLIKLLTAAYLFQQRKVFSAVGRDLLLKSEGEVKRLEGEHPIEIDACIGYLNTVKRGIEKSLVTFVESDLRSRFDPSSAYLCQPNCLYRIVQASTVLQQLSKVHVWPVSNWMYQYVAISLERLLTGFRSLVTMPTKTEPCGPQCCGGGRKSLTYESAQGVYAKKATDTEQTLPRLRYLCARGGSKMLTGGCSHPA
ncbi:hypothetical protein LTR10_005831 [Elasticomyces elasticus]|nr:hypothetical protein LTR10_005831 [Elasticomyces elasticus]KAK4965038.1 hypothetical protein LTR42_012456 [Elasticomyces elasticus]